jgi:hypothetical protein
MSRSRLEVQAREFAADLTRALQSSLPEAPSVDVEYVEDRLVFHPPPVPLFVKTKRLATLAITYRCQLDSRGFWLAISESTLALIADLDKIPVLRFDYRRDAQARPSAHVNVHAHRGALSHLLSQADHPRAHDMSALHIPVGGARSRPCLEDVVQFLIDECRFDSLTGWRSAVEEGRERWRRSQIRATVRDMPEDAAEVLEDIGYTVTRPEEIPADSKKALKNW